jgi:hypothetical protein
MVIKLLTRSKLTEKILVAESKRIEKNPEGSRGYTRHTGDRVGVQPTFMRQVSNVRTSWGSGTYAPHLVQVLAAYNVVGTRGGGGSMAAAIRGASKTAPVIIRVGEPGHWVVVVGHNAKTNTSTILDPGETDVVEIVGTDRYLAPRRFTPYWIVCRKGTAQRRVKVM